MLQKENNKENRNNMFNNTKVDLFMRNNNNDSKGHPPDLSPMRYNE